MSYSADRRQQMRDHLELEEKFEPLNRRRTDKNTAWDTVIGLVVFAIFLFGVMDIADIIIRHGH